MNWPGLEGLNQPKVPTLISYDPENPGSFTWGAQEHAGITVEHFKLLLGEDQGKPSYATGRHSAANLKRLGKSVEEVTRDYMKALYDHALSNIASRYPSGYVNGFQKKFILTVPAVWSDHAKDATLKVGDAFVVCDAGGGTADLISYEAKKLSPRLELTELVEPNGGMAGSVFVNKYFEQGLIDMIGEDEFHILKKKFAWKEARERFDHYVKPRYRGTDDETHLVSFPMAKLGNDIDNGLEDSCWSLKGREIKRFFAPVVFDIERLVEEQVQRIRTKRLSQGCSQSHEPRAILLVGGFGASMHLKQSLQQKFPLIEVVQPPDAWATIVKGAVLSLMPDKAIVTTSISKKHWGVAASCPYDATLDSSQEKHYNYCDGEYKVFKMTWFVSKEQELDRNKKVSFAFERQLPEPLNRDDLVFHDNLMTSNVVQAPKYPASGLTKEHCIVKADLRGLKKHNLRTKWGHDGRLYYIVDYDLTLTAISAGFQFALERKGRKFGSMETKWE
ncbi:MAG: hypothetical protein Q9162_004657 [Coniocarpon cinnabarinum]